jgi:hypothetical protein
VELETAAAAVVLGRTTADVVLGATAAADVALETLIADETLEAIAAEVGPAGRFEVEQLVTVRVMMAPPGPPGRPGPPGPRGAAAAWKEKSASPRNGMMLRMEGMAKKTGEDFAASRR